MASNSMAVEAEKNKVIILNFSQVTTSILIQKKKRLEEQGKSVQIVDISSPDSWPQGLFIDGQTKVIIAAHGSRGSAHISSDNGQQMTVEQLGSLIHQHTTPNTPVLNVSLYMCHGASGKSSKYNHEESFAVKLLRDLKNKYNRNALVSAKLARLSPSLSTLVKTESGHYAAKAPNSKARFSLNNEKQLTVDYPYGLSNHAVAAPRKIHTSKANGKKRNRLHVAAINNNTEELNQLLNYNTKQIDIGDANSRTPLHLAALYGNKEAVKLLVEKNANPDLADSRQSTALHFAAQSGHTEIVQLLLDKDANEVFFGHIVQQLLGKGVHAKDLQGRTPLHCAAQSGHEKIAQLLLSKGARVDVADSQNWTPLHVAAYFGHIDIVQLLLKEGADINAKNAQGNLPLHCAVKNGHTEIVQLLLNNGAKINAKDPQNQTPLHIAAYFGRREIVQLLLDEGATLDAKDPQNRTLLHAATYFGHIGIVQLLLKKDHSLINVKNAQGKTPLHLAAENGHTEIVQLLLEQGAALNAVDSQGYTPLYLAEKNDRKDIVQLLGEKNSAVSNTTPHPDKVATPAAYSAVYFWATSAKPNQSTSKNPTRGELEQNHLRP